MYFCTVGMALLIESPKYEGEVGVRAAAIGLMIGVPASVPLAMLLTPELVTGAGNAGLHALWTSRRERHLRLRCRGRRDDQHRARRIAYRALRDRAQQQAIDALSAVGADQNQVCGKLCGELCDGVCGGIDEGVGDHAKSRWHT